MGARGVVELCGEGEAVLEEILPRKTEIRRARALRRGNRPRPGKAAAEELVVAANVDQVLIVMASCTPPPRWSDGARTRHRPSAASRRRGYPWEA